MDNPLPPARDKTLFTPGPLTTSLTVKQAMLRDAGSWHFEFNAIVREIRERLLALAGVSREQGYECVLMQGSGSFGVEAVMTSLIPRDGKVLILANGAYGERIIQMAEHARIDHAILRCGEHEVPDADLLRETLAADATISHVAVVHCETTTGILNPIETLGPVVRESGRSLIVDAMSSFGALPIDFEAVGIDHLISSANKCLEGVPGFSFVIVRRSGLEAAEGHARSLCLDLLAQLRGFEKNGQFRYSPPTHSILAFRRALDELDMEGGIPARGERYRANHEALMSGMTRLGFRSYLAPEVQSPIITSFHFPDHANFTFDAFYRHLSDRGMIIYPGKIAKADLFRIGSIGRLFPSDMLYLTAAIESTLAEMGIDLR